MHFYPQATLGLQLGFAARRFKSTANPPIANRQYSRLAICATSKAGRSRHILADPPAMSDKAAKFQFLPEGFDNQTSKRTKSWDLGTTTWE
jgi:hypothetical protein